MIPNKEKITVTGNLTGEDVKMGLDPDSAEHLMDLLTEGLYEDPEMAVIREYSTNAYDAHVEAGNTDPIEFEIPSRLNPAFVIRDFGVGLDAEDIRRVYSLYGASTKRETNAQVGALGLGGKAGLALTDQFTVIGTKNGIRTTVSVAREQEGGGNMKILSEEETDDPNGVEVIVPATGGYYTERKVKNFFQFWPSGSVKIDGEPNEQLHGEKITDNIEAFKDGLDSDYIVMGNVAYPVEFGFNINLVAQVPIGAVDFPSNREALRDTSQTRDTIKQIKDQYTTRVHQVIQEKIDSAPSKGAALRAYQEVAFLDYSEEDYTYKGKKLPASFGYPEGKRETRQQKRAKAEKRSLTLLRAKNWGRGSSGEGAHRVETSLTRKEFAEAPLFIVNYDNKNWAAPTRRKLNSYVKEQVFAGKLPDGTQVAGAVLCRNPVPPNRQWIDVPVLDWQEVKAYRQKNQGGREKVAGTYDVWRFDASRPANKYNEWAQYDLDLRVDASKINTRTPLFWSNYENVRTFRHLADVYGQSIQVVVVNTHRQKKFLRSFPQAKSVKDAMHDAAKKWWEALPHYKKRMLRWDQSGDEITDWFIKTPIHKINDPEVREVVELERCLNKNEKLRNLWDEVYSDILNKEPLTYEQVDKRYPLIEGGTSFYGVTEAEQAKMRDHALQYVNTVYEAEKGRK